MASASNSGIGNSKKKVQKLSNFQKHLDHTFKAAAIMLPQQILNIGRVSLNSPNEILPTYLLCV